MPQPLSDPSIPDSPSDPVARRVTNRPCYTAHPSDSSDPAEVKDFLQKLDNVKIGFARFQIGDEMLDHSYGFQRELSQEGLDALCDSYRNGLERHLHPMCMAIDKSRIANLIDIENNWSRVGGVKDPALTLCLRDGDIKLISCLQGRHREQAFVLDARRREEEGHPILPGDWWWWFLLLDLGESYSLSIP